MDLFSKTIESVVHMARAKLFFTNVFAPKNEFHVISVAMIRYYVESTSTVRNSKLVNCHLASCIYCSDNRSEIVAAYRSEPILVNIAMSSTISDSAFTHFMGYVANQLMDRTLMLFNGGAGEIGEFIAQVVFLRAYDKSVFSENVNAELDAVPKALKTGPPDTPFFLAICRALLPVPLFTTKNNKS